MHRLQYVVRILCSFDLNIFVQNVTAQRVSFPTLTYPFRTKRQSKTTNFNAVYFGFECQLHCWTSLLLREEMHTISVAILHIITYLSHTFVSGINRQ